MLGFVLDSVVQETFELFIIGVFKPGKFFSCDAGTQDFNLK